MATRTLKEYLDEIGACEDPARLTGELHVYDNWPVLFYGDQDELFSKVTRAFRDSPKKGVWGIHGLMAVKQTGEENKYFAINQELFMFK